MLSVNLFWVLGAVVSGQGLQEVLGFDPKMGLIPAGTLDAFVRYLDPEVVTTFAQQIRQNPPVKLQHPGTLKPISIKSLIESFELGYMSICPSEKLVGFECICSKDYTTIETFDNPESQASVVIAVFPKKRLISVSYSFTKTIRNIIANIDAQAIQMPGAPEGVKVHSGFYEHYMSIHNQTMAKVNHLLQTEAKGYHIFASGYSLGASVAIMSVPFWHDFKKTTNVQVDVVSYSGARTGNLQAKLYFESLNIPVSRYANQDDIVSMLPPRSLDYSHVGVEIYEHASHQPLGTEFTTCRQDYDEDPNCQWREHLTPSAVHHAFPLNKLIPLPPYCNRENPSPLVFPSLGV